MHTITLCFMAYSHMAIYSKLIAWQCVQPKNPYISARLKRQRDRITKRYLGKLLIIEIRCLELLGKVNMDESDISVIKAALNTHLADTGLTVDDCFLFRIDYCYNVVIPDGNKRRLLMELWNKSASKWGRYRQYDGPTNTINRLYYKCKSRHFQLYDKTIERIDRGRPDFGFEQDVLRLEVQAYAGHLKGNRKSREKTFDEWADWTVRAQELHAAASLFSPGDFYTIRRAITLLRNSGQSPTVCSNIRAMLICISRNGLDCLRETSKNKKKFERDEKSIGNYKEILKSLNINLITIPQGAGHSYLDNPFQAALMGACPDS